MSLICWFTFFWKSWWCMSLQNRAILDACVSGRPFLSRAVLSAAVVFCGIGAAWAQSPHYLEARAKYERKEYLCPECGGKNLEPQFSHVEVVTSRKS